MLFGMAAASSAIDLIKTLTQSGTPKATGTVAFNAGTSSSTTATPSLSSSAGQTSLISPNTMNALLAAQSQSDTSSASATSRSAALKDLFAKIDGDGDGKITKSEFENALGAGGTNTANADSVFGKLDTDGDGSVSLGELASALKPKHHAHGPKQGGGQDALLQALDGASSTATTNSDGSITTSLTYADGSKVTMTQPATSSSSNSATRSYNVVEQMIQQQADMLTKTASSSLSVSV
jgi:Ca2+-binding EF-hand superfamily protein